MQQLQPKLIPFKERNITMLKRNKITKLLISFFLISFSVIVFSICYFWKGHFDEKVYKRIYSNIKIGDKTVSMPFTINELGEDYYVEENSIEYNENTIFGDLMHNGKFVLHFGTDSKQKEITEIDIRNSPVTFITATYPNCEEDIEKTDLNILNQFSIDGIKFGDSKRKILRKYGEPASRDDSEIDGEQFGYYPNIENYDKMSSICPVYYEFDKSGKSGKLQHIFLLMK